MSERHVCTKDDPYDAAKHDRAEHPDAQEVGDQEDGWPGGDIQRYHCPNCGKDFSVELPQ